MTGGAAAAARVPTIDEARRLIGLEIAVPASSANLGPGFDTLAVALQLYLRLRVCDVLDADGSTLVFDHCGARLTGDNYIERAFRAAWGDRSFPSLSLEARSDIPMQGGLGSSAAATVAGLHLCTHLAGGTGARDLLRLATALDGHSDNVSASLLGGVTTSCECEDGRVLSFTRHWPEAVQFVIASPAVCLGTPESRSVLPENVARQDAVFNLQRALLLWEALGRGDLDAIAEALRDRLHQPFRAPLVPGFAELLALKHPQLLGVTLSGSGPSVLAWCAGDTEPIAAAVRGVYERLGVGCRVRVVAVHQPVDFRQGTQ